MIEKNRPAFEITNVLTWQQDNLGEGTTIVVLDEGLEPHKHMAHQVEVMTFGEVKANAPKIGHGSGVMSIIYEVAPKARIVYFPFNNVSRKQCFDMLEWIIDHSEEIDVITMSMTFFAPTAREYFDTIKWLKIPFTVASGNDGDIDANGVSSPADFDYTLAIGAAGAGNTGQASYSNGGKALMCIAPVILAPNATNPEFSRAGTSFATPFVAGALSLYTSWRRRNKLPKITHDMAVELIKANAKDIVPKRENSDYTVGFDYPTGWGLFRLPSEVPKVVVETPEPEPNPEPEVPIIETPVEVIEQVAVKLMIDAGHGGDDTGAYSGGIREKDLNLLVARRVRELLKNHSPAITRTEDTLLIWDKRAAMIKDAYDYCMSVHFNYGGGRVTGTGSGSPVSYVEAISSSLVRTTLTALAGAVASARTANTPSYAVFHDGTNVSAYNSSLVRATPVSMSANATAGESCSFNGYGIFPTSTTSFRYLDDSLTSTLISGRQQRGGIASASTTDLLFFAGGSYNENFYSVVDCYDTSFVRTSNLTITGDFFNGFSSISNAFFLNTFTYSGATSTTVTIFSTTGVKSASSIPINVRDVLGNSIQDYTILGYGVKYGSVLTTLVYYYNPDTVITLIDSGGGSGRYKGACGVVGDYFVFVSGSTTTLDDDTVATSRVYKLT